jgi:hypothetical protein
VQNKQSKTSGDSKRCSGLPRVGRLETIEDVRAELSKVYRAARTGRIEMNDAKGLCYLLVSLGALVKDGALEARIAALEQQLHAEGTNQ